jgi:hypothetical protein
MCGRTWLVQSNNISIFIVNISLMLDIIVKLVSWHTMTSILVIQRHDDLNTRNLAVIYIIMNDIETWGLHAALRPTYSSSSKWDYDLFITEGFCMTLFLLNNTFYLYSFIQISKQLRNLKDDNIYM